MEMASAGGKVKDPSKTFTDTHTKETFLDLWPTIHARYSGSVVSLLFSFGPFFVPETQTRQHPGP